MKKKRKASRGKKKKKGGPDLSASENKGRGRGRQRLFENLGRSPVRKEGERGGAAAIRGGGNEDLRILVKGKGRPPLGKKKGNCENGGGGKKLFRPLRREELDKADPVDGKEKRKIGEGNVP